MTQRYIAAVIFVISTISAQIATATPIDSIEECQRYLRTSSRWEQWVQEVERFKNESFLNFDYHYSIGVVVFREFSRLIPNPDNIQAEEAFNRKRKITQARELTFAESSQLLEELGILIQQVAAEAHHESVKSSLHSQYQL